MSVREYNQIQKGAVLECQKCGLMVRRESAIKLDE